MNKNRIFKILLTFVIIITVVFSTGCKKNDKVIRVSASQLPHADILRNCVADILEEQGYTLKVYVLDWTLQNDSLANKDYEANYFQHTDFLEAYEGKTELMATCKVHYEPLGVYRGKANGNLLDGKTFAICDDSSNAIRALELLYELGVINTLPVNEEGKLAFTASSWTDENGVEIKLISEELLVPSMPDYDFICLPANTALTGNVSQDKKVAEETKSELISGRANILAVREDDYHNDEKYKTKIDVLTEALLSKEVADYIKNKYSGAVVCNELTQIDLR